MKSRGRCWGSQLADARQIISCDAGLMAYIGAVLLFRILSLDGGGIRGLLSILLLERLIEESATPDLIDRVDLFAGTSTGGLIALGLAAEIPLAKIRNLYLREGLKIFSENSRGQLRDIGNLFQPQYSNRELKKILGEIFGDRKLGHLKGRVMIPAFEFDNLKNKRTGEARRWKAKIFHLKSVYLTEAVNWIRQNWRSGGWMGLWRQNPSNRIFL